MSKRDAALMSGLKSIIATSKNKNRGGIQGTSTGGKGGGFVRRGDLKRERERQEREQENEHEHASAQEDNGEDMWKRNKTEGGEGQQSIGENKDVSECANDPESSTSLSMSVSECKRLLRRFGEPSTLFGESDIDRERRYARVKQEVKVVDDSVKGGQQENEMRHIMRETEKILFMNDRRAEMETKNKGKTEHTGNASTSGGETGGMSRGGSNMRSYNDSDVDNDTQISALNQQFELAARRLAKQREAEQDARKLGDGSGIGHSGAGRIIRAYFERLEDEWQEELGDREDHVKRSVHGKQATVFFLETRRNLKILYEKMEKSMIDVDVLKGLWLIVEAMKTRNYLNATDIYVRLAIGNAPWPIGVTSVGIHERSAREKISHAMNQQSAAHVMNDEGTRKWLQSVKRLLTFAQRRYPTDPSRCINFNAQQSEGFGRSDLLALKRAEERGETKERLALPAAPHHHDKDGSIKPPQTWKAVLNNADRKMKEMM